MAGWDSILQDLIGAALIIAALTALAVIVKLAFAALSARRSKEQAGAENAQSGESAIAESAQGELKLLGTDEKTAALIMAVVSDESGIPLSELNFRSIKLID